VFLNCLLLLALAASQLTNARQMFGAARWLKRTTIPGLAAFPPAPTSPVATDQNPNTGPAMVSCQATSKSTAYSVGQSALAEASACLRPVACMRIDRMRDTCMHLLKRCRCNSHACKRLQFACRLLAASADCDASVPPFAALKPLTQGSSCSC
jgi:hypothetical protein